MDAKTTTYYVIDTEDENKIVADGLSRYKANKMAKETPGYVARKGEPPAVEPEVVETLTEDLFESPEQMEAFEEQLAEAQNEDLYTVRKGMADEAAKPLVVPPAPAPKNCPKLEEHDLQVLAWREAKVTWKQIAGRLGWDWDGPNMDGGRGRRAMLRAKRYNAFMAAAREAARAEMVEELALGQDEVA